MIKEYLESLYIENNYEKQFFDGGVLFALKDSNKVNFNILINSNPSDILDIQHNIFDSCKTMYNNPAFDKNCALIVLWEIDEKVEVNTIKNKILKVEEDPYIFRKYVLYYKKSELESLIKNLNENTLNQFIKLHANNSKIFEGYKNALTSSWQSLLYRIIFKFTFLKIKTEEGKTLKSLIEENNAKLTKENLKEINNKIFKVIEDLPLKNEKTREESIELYNLFRDLLEEN